MGVHEPVTFTIDLSKHFHPFSSRFASGRLTVRIPLYILVIQHLFFLFKCSLLHAPSCTLVIQHPYSVTQVFVASRPGPNCTGTPGLLLISTFAALKHKNGVPHLASSPPSRTRLQRNTNGNSQYRLNPNTDQTVVANKKRKLEDYAEGNAKMWCSSQLLEDNVNGATLIIV